MLVNCGKVFQKTSDVARTRNTFLWNTVHTNGNLSYAAVENIIDAPHNTELVGAMKQMLSDHHSMTADVVVAIIDLAGGLEDTAGAELVKHIAGLMSWGTPTRYGVDMFKLRPPRNETRLESRDFYARSMRFYRRCVRQQEYFISQRIH